MAIGNLNDQEKNILTQLSYIDLKFEEKPLSMKEIIKQLEILPEYKSGEIRIKNVVDFLKNNPNSNLHKLTLTGYENNNPKLDNLVSGKSNTGFVGYAFKDENNGALAVYRGSEGKIGGYLTDWASNFIAGLGFNIKQQDEALKFYDNYVGTTSGEKLVIGHSKGGNLATHVFINRLGLKAYVINGQPIWWAGLNDAQKKALKGEDYEFIVINGDFVSSLGYSAKYIDKIISFESNLGDGFVAPHYEYNAKIDENGNYIIEKNPYKDFWGQGLTALVASIGISLINEGSKNFVKGVNTLNELFEFLAGATIEVIKSLSKERYKLADKIAISVENFIKSALKATNEAIDTLKKWFKEVKNKVINKIKEGKEKLQALYGSTQQKISINIFRINDYSRNLVSIENRVNGLNKQIDSLYRKLGILGIFQYDHIAKAQILTEGNVKIRLARKYLDDTRDKFNQAEARINKIASTMRIV